MKKLFDLLCISILLPFWMPAFVIIYVATLIMLGNPIFFSQSRGGKSGEAFNIIKFRTMSNKRDSIGNLLPDEKRLTRFGKFLRKTSLDELPSIWNVIIRNMSIVGPRPFKSEYLSLYSKEQMRRHEVFPGITGWAQVNGRNAISWEEKFKLDIWYVDNRSVWLDLKILFLTVKRVIMREGVRSECEASYAKISDTISSTEH